MKDIFWGFAFLLVLAGAFATYRFLTVQQPRVVEQTGADSSAPEQPPETPKILYPIAESPDSPQSGVTKSPDDVSVEKNNGNIVQSPVQVIQLPLLDESDGPLLESLSQLVSTEKFRSLFNLTNIVRRFVTTVDNLSRKNIPQKYLITKPVSGRFVTRSEADVVYLDKKNYSRYQPLISLLDSLDLEKLVAVYIHFYPLFQEAYEDLGYPSAYFNDRLIKVIDQLVATPEIRTPVKLVRPRILFQYADPELEQLSSGQKILIRIGPDNAGKVKESLQRVRKLLLR